LGNIRHAKEARANQVSKHAKEIINFVSEIYKLFQLGVVPTRKLENTFASKSAKLAKPDPPELSPNASELVVIFGACDVRKGQKIKTNSSQSKTRSLTWTGRGGAGRGGGCLAFLGGRAGLGDSGLGGGPAFDGSNEWLVAGGALVVGACKIANGSHPNPSLLASWADPLLSLNGSLATAPPNASGLLSKAVSNPLLKPSSKPPFDLKASEKPFDLKASVAKPSDAAIAAGSSFGFCEKRYYIHFKTYKIKFSYILQQLLRLLKLGLQLQRILGHNIRIVRIDGHAEHGTCIVHLALVLLQLWQHETNLLSKRIVLLKPM
jgi:hypothetical protein